jgi:hypothetical protein
MKGIQYRAGFLNLCSAEHWCSAAPFLVFRRIIKKLKNRLSQMKEIRKSFWFCHVIDKKKNYIMNVLIYR